MKTNWPAKKIESGHQSLKNLEIGICINYGDKIYTLATVTFKQNLDIILWQPYGDIYNLGGSKKFDPHVTYHGKDGVHHIVAYSSHSFQRTKQRIDANFVGKENIISQAFGRDYAKKLGQVCKNSHPHIQVDSISIKEKVDVIRDHLGEVKSQLPTASFQIDLIEPNRKDLLGHVVLDSQRVIKQKLFTVSFPWCLITIFEQR